MESASDFALLDLCGNRSGGAKPLYSFEGDGEHAHNVVVTPV